MFSKHCSPSSFIFTISHSTKFKCKYLSNSLSFKMNYLELVHSRRTLNSLTFPV
uniref:Uncharacterized protein n=1 Tax=Octopus bimaculoides TaxID=37653 RepID=A0A0L8GD68_OCTBM